MLKRATLILLLSTMIVTVFVTVPLGEALTVKWTAETQLTTDTSFDAYPSVVQMKDGKMWVVWQSNRISGPRQTWKIFYRVRDGSFWTEDTLLAMNETWQNGKFRWYDWHDVTPSILETKNGVVWIVWATNRTGNYDIFFKTTDDNGLTWTDERQLTTSAENDNAPAICQTSDQAILIVWQRKLSGSENYDIFLKKTLDYGSTWSSDTRLTTNSAPDKLPSIIQARNGRIWVVWQSYRDNDMDIYYKTSLDNGAKWSTETRLTTENDLDTDPAIYQTISGRIWVVYASRQPVQTSQDDLYYMTSDNGVTWSSRVQLTNDVNDDLYPAITQSKDRKIWVVWVSDRALQPDGNPDVFYKKSIALYGDVNEDGVVNIYDLALIGIAYKTKLGDSNYNPAADLDGDGYVNIWDLYYVAVHYGEQL